MEDQTINIGPGRAWVHYMYSAAKEVDDFKILNVNATMDDGRPNVSEFIKFYDFKVNEMLEYLKSAPDAENYGMLDSIRKNIESDRSPASLSASRKVIMDCHSGVRKNMGPTAVNLDDMLSNCITIYNYVSRLSDYKKI